MPDIRSFFRQKFIGFYCTVFALICALIGMAFFLVTMNQQQNMVPAVVIVTVIGVVGGLVTCYKDYLHLLTILSAVTYLLAGLLFFVQQLENIGYALADVGIGDGVMGSFITSMVFYTIACIVAIVAAYCRQEK